MNSVKNKYTLLVTDFGEVDQQPVKKFVISSTDGIMASLINYGGIVTSLMVPDREGVYADVVIGFNELGQYVTDQHAIGSLIGRYANRINQGKVMIEGAECQLTQNQGKHHLHGGSVGFGKVVWDVSYTEETAKGIKIVFGHSSKSGQEGYPGDLDLKVTFSFIDNQFAIEYQGVSSESTVLNPTHHLYFNLSGDFSSDVLDHEVQINAAHYLPTLTDQIPTGEIAKVSSTPFDFFPAKKLVERMDLSHEQLVIGNGYDHCFALDKGVTEEAISSATLSHQKSGRMMEVQTTEPGIQLYTGNYLSELITEKSGSPLVKHGGLCLETQHFPDSPNHPQFPSTILRKGEIFTSRTIYQFGVC